MKKIFHKSITPSFLWRAGLLFALVLAVYYPSVHNGYIWDDDCYVTANTTLKNPGGLKAIWLERGATIQYYPMTFTSFWIEYQLFGPDPTVYHVTNIILHGINTLLVWLILAGMGLPWAWAVAAIFAIHPVNVESVAWIAERKNVLSGTFILSSLLVLVRLYLPDQRQPHRSINRKTAPYLFSLFLFILALFSKSVTCMMPVVFMVMAWWKKDQLPFKTVLGIVPFLLAGIAAGINTMLMEKTVVGAQGAGWEFSILERILIAGRALWFYAGKLIWPAENIFIYPRWNINAAEEWRYLFPAAAAALMLVLFIVKKRVGKGPFAGTAVFVITLFPALGFINYYPMRFTFVADHFAYLASIVFITLAASAVFRLAANRKTAYIAACGLLILMIPVLGVRSWEEQKKYDNLQALWEDTICENPSCVMALNNLGCVFMNDRKAPEKAIEHFTKALGIDPGYAEARYNLGRVHLFNKDFDTAGAYFNAFLEQHPSAPTGLRADAHYNLGVVLTRQKKFDAADAHFATAMKTSAFSAENFNDLGIVMKTAGRPARAVEFFTKALTMNPDYYKARYNLAESLYDNGQTKQALSQLDILAGDANTPPALAADAENRIDLITTEQRLLQDMAAAPDDAALLYQLGLLMMESGKNDSAVDAFTRAVALDPDDFQARYRLALISAENGHKDKAMAHYKYITNRPQKAPPDLLAAVNNDLGVMYAEHDQDDTAIEHFRRALALAPDFAEAHNNLGLTLAAGGRDKEAVSHFTRALSLRPDFPDAANNLVLLYRKSGQYDSALLVLQSLLDAAPQSSASISYNIGCLYAIRGGLEKAVFWLNRAIDDGFCLQDLMEKDKDLESIRDSRYYPDLLHRMQMHRLNRK